jgi:hypothetical protein
MRKSNIKHEVIPTPQKVWDRYYESVDADSLLAAFEVADDEIERNFRMLLRS